MTTPTSPDLPPPPAIQWRRLADLLPYARNPRTHSDEQVAQLASSLVEYGWTNPVLTNGERGILAGHGRVTGARKVWDEGKDIPMPGQPGVFVPRGWIPCLDLSHLSEDQQRAYVIADNKLALNAGWDMSLLRDELLALDHANFALDLTGFGQEEITEIMEWAPGGRQAEDEGDSTVIGDNRHLLLLEFADEATLQAMFNEMQSRGISCKIMD